MRKEEKVKVVILAGGYGTRISEESHLKPKPMIEIGGKPIIWHIMKHYSAYGHHEFIICCGYKQHVIKQWFADYYLYNCDVTFDLADGNRMTVHNNVSEPWKVTLVDTGLDTMTGGRIKRIQRFIGDDTFLMTYGDAVSDVDLDELVRFHKTHGKIVTITAVNVGQRYGIMEIDEEDSTIRAFREKDEIDQGIINGGFMVLGPRVFDYLKDDGTVFEKEPVQKMVEERQLAAFMHNGFWQNMDTQRDRKVLEDLIAAGNTPWMTWKNKMKSADKIGD